MGGEVMLLTAATDIWAGVNLGDHFAAFAPELTLVATMLAVVLAPVLLGRKARVVGTVATLGIAAALVLAVRMRAAAHAGGLAGFTADAWSGVLIADPLANFFKCILLVFLAAVTALWWMGSAGEERDAPEFFILLIGSALGMAMMVSTTNLLMMVIAIETASLPSYAIVGFDKRNPRAAEASLKYAVFGAISAAMMIYGVSLLYGVTGGSLEFGDAARAWLGAFGSSDRLLVGLGLVCTFAGIAFKISAVPMHFWCPDAFEGARVEVTTWLSVVSKAAGLLLLTRFVQVICAQVPLTASDADWAPHWPKLAPLAWGIGLVAIVTCTWANFAAYRQSNVKRLLAYSSIAHAGYMLMSAAIFLNPRVPDGATALSALLAYVVIYLFMNLGAFTVVSAVAWRTRSEDISAFTGLIYRAPWLAVPMVICLVSLVGLPPFAGFIGKWWVLVALGQQGTTLSWVLVSAAAANTLFSLYYYMRLVVQMTLKDDGRAAVSAPVGAAMIANGCAVVLLALFVLVGPLKRTADAYAAGAYSAKPRPVSVAVETPVPGGAGNAGVASAPPVEVDR